MKLAAYKVMINEIIKAGVKHQYKSVIVRPINKVGSYSHAQYGVDHTNEYTSYLDSLNVKYTMGNDSPRGGQLGKFIEIKIDRRNTFIKGLV